MMQHCYIQVRWCYNNVIMMLQQCYDAQQQCTYMLLWCFINEKSCAIVLQHYTTMCNYVTMMCNPIWQQHNCVHDSYNDVTLVGNIR